MNRRAFLKESEERLLGSERFPMLVIKVHNLKVMRQTLGNDSVNEFLKEMVAFFVSLLTIPVFTSFHRAYMCWR